MELGWGLNGTEERMCLSPSSSHHQVIETSWDVRPKLFEEQASHFSGDSDSGILG